MLDNAAYIEAVKSHPAFDRLWAYIQNEYQEATFATSWTTYGMCASTEEQILMDCFAVLKPDAEFPGFDTLKEMPEMMCVLVQKRATKQSEMSKAVEFLNDAIADAMFCNVREDADHDLEEDLIIEGIA